MQGQISYIVLHPTAIGILYFKCFVRMLKAYKTIAKACCALILDVLASVHKITASLPFVLLV